MGAVLGGLGLSSLACCFGSAACSLCCAVCPSCKNSTSSRIMYAGVLVVTMIVSCIFLSPGLQSTLAKLPFCKGAESGVGGELLEETDKFDCQEAVGYLSVYRLCFAVTVFFLVLSVMMIGVKSSRDKRAGIQNGFWGLKYLVIIGGTVAAFFITGDIFSTLWMYIGFVGAFFFILIQLVLIIDFAHTWAETWVGNFEESEHKGWMAALIGSTILMFLGCLTAVTLFVTNYTGHTIGDCKLHLFFIVVNTALCLALSILSILPKVQEALPRSGLLQSASISLYIMYLTWSAMSSSPDLECKLNFRPGSGNGTDINGDDDAESRLDKESIIGLLIWFLCVLYSSIRSSTSDNASKLGGTSLILSTEDNETRRNDEDAEGQRVWDNEEETVAYNWSLFHLLFALATLYVMMTITNWLNPTSDLATYESNPGAMWVKMVSSWFCGGLYLWSLVAPLVLEDRDFN